MSSTDLRTQLLNEINDNAYDADNQLAVLDDDAYLSESEGDDDDDGESEKNSNVPSKTSSMTFSKTLLKPTRNVVQKKPTKKHSKKPERSSVSSAVNGEDAGAKSAQLYASLYPAILGPGGLLAPIYHHAEQKGAHPVKLMSQVDWNVMITKIDFKDDVHLCEAMIATMADNAKLHTCTEVTLDGCVNLTDGCLSILAQMMHKARFFLKKVSLCRCPNVTSAGVECLVSLLPFVDYLDIRHCSVGPWLGHNNQAWMKPLAYANTRAEACPALTKYYGYDVVNHDSLVILHPSASASSSSSSSSLPCSISHLLTQHESVPYSGITVQHTPYVLPDKQLTLIEMDSKHSALPKLLPADVDSVMLPFNMAASVEEVAEAQADVIVSTLANKINPACLLEDGSSSSMNAKPYSLGLTISYLYAAEIDFKTGILTCLEPKPTSSSRSFLMFDEFLSPATPEISFDVISVGENAKVVMVEKGKQRDIEFKTLDLQVGQKILLQAHKWKGGSIEYALFVDGEQVDNRSRSNYSYSRIYFKQGGVGMRLKFDNLNGFAEGVSMSGKFIPQAFNFYSRPSMCIDIPTGLLTCTPDVVDGGYKKKGRLKSLNSVSAENNVIRLKLVGPSWAGLTVGIGPELWTENKNAILEGWSFTEDMFGGKEGDILQFTVVKSKIGNEDTQDSLDGRVGMKDKVDMHLKITDRPEEKKSVQLNWTSDGERVVFGIILTDAKCQVQVLNWLPQPRPFMGEIPFAPHDEFLLNRNCTLQQGSSKSLIVVYGIGLLNLLEGCIARNSLTKNMSEFTVELKTAPEMPAVGIGVGHYGYHWQRMPGWLPQSVGLHLDNGKIYLWDDETLKGEKLENETVETKQGDKITCGMDVSGIRKWNGVLPAPNQDITIYWKVNGEEKVRQSYRYAGGGVHPHVGVAQKKISIKWCNKLDLGQLAEILPDVAPESEVARDLPMGLHIYPLGISEGTSPPAFTVAQFGEAIVKTTSDRIQKRIEQIQEIEDTQLALMKKEDAADSNKEMTGVLWREKSSLNTLSQSLEQRITPLEINTDDMKGLSSLVTSLTSRPPSRFLPTPLHKMAATILALREEDEHRVCAVGDIVDMLTETVSRIVADTHDMDLQEEVASGTFPAVVKKLLDLLHNWGLLLMSGDHVILNGRWLTKVLRDLPAGSPDTCQSQLPCVHNDTRLWADRSLLDTAWEHVPLDKLHVLLDIVLSWHQVLRIPAVSRQNPEDVKYYLLPVANLLPQIPEHVKLTDYWSSSEKVADSKNKSLFKCRVTYKVMLGLDLSVFHDMLARICELSQPTVLWREGMIWHHGANEMIVIKENDVLYLQCQCYSLQKDTAYPEKGVLHSVQTFHSLIKHSLEGRAYMVTHDYSTTENLTEEEIKQLMGSQACVQHTFERPSPTTPALKVTSVCTQCHGCSVRGVSCDWNGIRKQLIDGYMECACQTTGSDGYTTCWNCGICRTCAQKLQVYSGGSSPYVPEWHGNKIETTLRGRPSPNSLKEGHIFILDSDTTSLDPQTNPSVVVSLQAEPLADKDRELRLLAASNTNRSLLPYRENGLEHIPPKRINPAKYTTGLFLLSENESMAILYPLKDQDGKVLQPETSLAGRDNLGETVTTTPVKDNQQYTVTILDPYVSVSMPDIIHTRMRSKAVLWQSSGIISFMREETGLVVAATPLTASMEQAPNFSVEVMSNGDEFSVGLVASIHPEDKPVGHSQYSCGLQVRNREAIIISEGKESDQSVGSQTINEGDIIVCGINKAISKSSICVTFALSEKKNKGSMHRDIGSVYVGHPGMDLYPAVSGMSATVTLRPSPREAWAAMESAGDSQGQKQMFQYGSSISSNKAGDFEEFFRQIGHFEAEGFKISPAKTVPFQHSQSEKGQSEGWIVLDNTLMESIVFKVKVTDPNSYLVRPNKGVLAKGEKIVLDIRLKDQEHDVSVDKLMIQYISLYRPMRDDETTESVFASTKDIPNHKLLCAVSSSQIPRPADALQHYMGVSAPTDKDTPNTEAFNPDKFPCYKLEVSKHGTVIDSAYVPRQLYKIGKVHKENKGFIDFTIGSQRRRGLRQSPEEEVNDFPDDVHLVMMQNSRTKGNCKDMWHTPAAQEHSIAEQSLQFRRWEMIFDEAIHPYISLPRELSDLHLYYPSLVAMTQNLGLHLLCKDIDFNLDGYCPPMHMMNAKETVPKGHLKLTDAQYFASTIPVWSYTEMATTKCLLPVYDNLLTIKDPSSSRTVLQCHMSRLLRLYALQGFINAAVPGQDMRQLAMDKLGNEYGSIQDVLQDNDFPTSDGGSGGDANLLVEEKWRCQAHMKYRDNTIEFPDKDFTPYGEHVNMLMIDCGNMDAFTDEQATKFPNLQALELQNTEILEVFMEKLSVWPALSKLHIIGSRQLHSVFKKLPEDIGSCTDLEDLVVKCSDLDVIPASIEECTKLTRMVLHTNKISKLPDNMAALRMLVKLDLNLNVLSSIPQGFGQLKCLETLKLGGVPWLSGWGGNKYGRTFISKWMVDHPQNQKIIGKERILELYNECDLLKVAKEGSTELATFNANLYYSIPRLGHDFIGGDEDGGIPAEIFELTNLRELQLQYQGIRFVPEAVSALKQLTTLNLNHCPLLESLPGSLGTLNHMTSLSLRNCPALRTPPLEIVSRGLESTMGYLKRMDENMTENWTTKLMFVGLGGAGKTSLLRALKSDKKKTSEAPADEQITDGIDIDHWSVKDKETGNTIIYNTWDFAGQTVYYNTHQFFLTEGAVYLLLWTTRLGYEHAGLDFWLSSIQCHAPKAPIFIVGTHCDKVAKSEIPQKELKQKYSQICGFHYVSSITGKGIEELQENILAETVNLSFMGAKVPTVYLQLDNKIQLRRKEESVIDLEEVKKLCMEMAIYEEKDINQAMQFLHDLGTVQYFDNEFLKDHVVINPQWIVNVMACVVSVKDSPIKDGRFHHDDIMKVWKDYPEKLREWLLRLTEEFDLTFPLPKEPYNLVPSLLPRIEPDYTWPEVSKGMKETLIYYRFTYLPAGLFNRAQVRLFQFSDGKIIWKTGSLLRKSGHLALVKQVNDKEMSVTVQGPRPDNVLFLVHEVIESLIRESFHGVEYQYLVPCPDCLNDTGTYQPCMFEATFIREAITYNAPFLQCRKSFHTVSMPLLQAVMPPDSSAEFDNHLEQSVQALHDLRNNMSMDLFISYCDDNIPKGDDTDSVHPQTIAEDMQKEGYKVWYQDNMNSLAMKDIMMALQDSKIMVVCVSTEYENNEKCRTLFLHAKETLHKPYIIVILGRDFNMNKAKLGYTIGPQEVYVNMNKKSRYPSKIDELRKSVKMKMSVFSETEHHPECFLSYCWSNSHDAVLVKKSKLVTGALGPESSDPRAIQAQLEKEGISCWLDIQRVGKRGLFKDISIGVKNAKVMVACVSEQYSMSANCMMELRFAICSLNMPVVVVVVGTGNGWMWDELGMLMQRSKTPCINFQQDSPVNFDLLLKTVREMIEKAPERRPDDSSMESKPQDVVEMANMEYKEEYELAQRKFLRRVEMLAAGMDTIFYPRLFLLDFDETDAAATTNFGGVAGEDGEVITEKPSKVTFADAPQRPKSAARPTTARRSLHRRDTKASLSGEPLDWTERALCIKILCEHEQGWHWVKYSSVSMEGSEAEELIKDTVGYWHRMIELMKYSGLPLELESMEHGQNMKERIAEMASSSEMNFSTAYIKLRERVIQMDENKRKGGLERCYMPTGLIRWLCPEHQRAHRVTVLSSDAGGSGAGAQIVTEDDIMLTEAILRHSDKLGAQYKTEREPRQMPKPGKTNNSEQDKAESTASGAESNTDKDKEKDEKKDEKKHEKKHHGKDNNNATVNPTPPPQVKNRPSSSRPSSATPTPAPRKRSMVKKPSNLKDKADKKTEKAAKVVADGSPTSSKACVIL